MPNGGFDDLPDSLIAKQLADLMVKDKTESMEGNQTFHPIALTNLPVKFWELIITPSPYK